MATIAKGEVTQPEILKEVIRDLVRPTGGAALRSAVDAHFDDNVVLTSGLFTVKGKKNLYHLFHFWQNMLDDRVEVLDVAAHGNTVLAKIRHNLMLRPFHLVKHYVPGVITNLLTIPFIVNAEFEIMQTARGRKIVAWKEDISVYTLIYNIVWGTKIFNFWEYVETAVGQSIVIADQIGTQAYDLVVPVVAPHADRALRSADRMIKDTVGVDTGLSTVPQRFWA
eukprot:GHUV01004067.1.p1 GENE.GHUV01004067.1~~GHUV01004067.1.p1  ORF type:complete len:224 (+),score=43.87 GHUV01004067.1:334-1005(+)